MPARTIEEQQESTCFAVVFICLLIAIISNIEYNSTDNENARDKLKSWFIPCYSIAGGFTLLAIIKKLCEYKRSNSQITSVPV